MFLIISIPKCIVIDNVVNFNKSEGKTRVSLLSNVSSKKNTAFADMKKRHAKIKPRYINFCILKRYQGS